MSIGLRLDLRQSQQLVMTPQLQQAIKLLQMSNLELADYVDSELEKNPLLQLDGDHVRDAESKPADVAPAATDKTADDHTLAEETFDTGGENLHDTGPSESPAPTSDYLPLGNNARDSLEAHPSLEERLAQKPSLREHLREQIGQTSGGLEVAIALYLVEELDEHGYLRSGLDEIAERLVSDPDTVRAGLILLQGCEPTGVGARDLAECLRLQAHELGTLDAPMSAVLDNLDLLGHGKIRKLRALSGVAEQEFSDLIRRLRELDPRPCGDFDTTEPETLVPDILLRRTDWGGWHIELNPDTLPAVLIDRTYESEIGKSACPDANKFLAECHSTANWLIKSLDQRSRTIIKIASEIVRQQEAFFEQGVSGLRPLTLSAVADSVGMHESTVSRVTSNKYIHTHRGIFEMKFFFTNALGGDGGDVAAEAVRHRIRAMVNAEAPHAILSDDAIVESLAREGIEIARRTVAKYRKSLNIPSSVERRRQKSFDVAL